MQTVFEGIWVPIVTPWQGDGIDHGALTRLAQHLRAAGVHGLVAGATTGEGVLYRAGEMEAVISTLRLAVPELPLVVGVTHADTHAACAIARAAAALKPDGLLVTAPMYVRPSQAGVRAHFEALAEAADLPILVYDIPYRTGVTLALDTLQALAADRRIVGIKICGASLEHLLRVIEDTPLSVLCGDDSANFTALCLGAHGSISASAHVRPDWHVRMYDQLRAGNMAGARRIATALAPVIRHLFAEPNPAPLKAWLAMQGLCESTVRLPFLPVSAELQAQLAHESARLTAHPDPTWAPC